jgi:hypothetical protein
MDSRSRKMMLAVVAAAALAAVPLTAFAQAAPAKPAASVDGKWNMKVTGPGGEAMQIAVAFKQDGKKLTGTLTSPQGEVPLEGEYADGKIMFAISVPSDSGPMNIGFAGNMKDDGSLAGMASGPFGEIPWTAVKSK